ncbi:MAG: hypothetical protein Q9166_001208 [cf. Caloplaca sp. 2 TL-2023]
MSTQSTSPLKSRDVNTSIPSPTKSDKPSTMTESEKPKSMEYHRQVLQSRLEEDKYVSVLRSKHTYVSPSDMIMSPATKKLEVLKGKRFGKAKGQSLFANTTSKNAAANHNGSLDAEVGKAMEGEGKE